MTPVNNLLPSLDKGTSPPGRFPAGLSSFRTYLTRLSAGYGGSKVRFGSAATQRRQRRRSVFRPQRTVSLRDGNGSSCPVADIRQVGLRPIV
jgi:hypothetical protein